MGYQVQDFSVAPLFCLENCWWLLGSQWPCEKAPGHSFKPAPTCGHWFCLPAPVVLLYKVRLLNLCFFAVSGLPGDLCPGQSRAHLQVLGAQRGSLVQLGYEGVWFSCVTHWHSAGSWAGMQDFYLLLTALLLWSALSRFSWGIQVSPLWSMFAGLFMIFLPYSKCAVRYLTNIHKIQIRKSWRRGKRVEIKLYKKWGQLKMQTGNSLYLFMGGWEICFSYKQRKGQPCPFLPWAVSVADRFMRVSALACRVSFLFKHMPLLGTMQTG